MKAIYILPEMAQAGAEALVECQVAKMDEKDTAVEVYLAMVSVAMIAAMKRSETETVH